MGEERGLKMGEERGLKIVAERMLVGGSSISQIVQATGL